MSSVFSQAIDLPSTSGRESLFRGTKLLTDPGIIRLLGEQDNLPEHFGSEQVIPYSGGVA
jgi:hypothetical protein